MIYTFANKAIHQGAFVQLFYDSFNLKPETDVEGALTGLFTVVVDSEQLEADIETIIDSCCVGGLNYEKTIKIEEITSRSSELINQGVACWSGSYVECSESAVNKYLVAKSYFTNIPAKLSINTPYMVATLNGRGAVTYTLSDISTLADDCADRLFYVYTSLSNSDGSKGEVQYIQEVNMCTTIAQVQAITDTRDGGVAPPESGDTELILDNDSDYTITELNTETALESFLSIDTVVTGDVGLIDLDSIEYINFGDQIDNNLLTGDVGVMLNTNDTLDSFSLIGGNTNYSQQTYSNIVNGMSIYLKDTDWSSSEVDQILNDIAPFAADIRLISIVGVNGYPTSSSAASITILENAGVTLELNSIPITGLSYSNTGQTFSVGQAITNMSPIIVPNGATVFFQSFGNVAATGVIPDGLSIDDVTGIISGTPTIEDNYVMVVRATGYGDYAGVVEISIPINVQAVIAPTSSRVLINMTKDASNVASPDINGSNWTNIDTSSATPNASTDGYVFGSDIIDVDGNISGIGFEVVSAIDADTGDGSGGNNVGTGATVGDYVSPSGTTSWFCAGSGEWKLTGLDSSSTYNITFWGSRSAAGSKYIEIATASDFTGSQNYNGENNLDENESATFAVTGVTEQSFYIRPLAGSTFGYIGVIEINIA